MGESIKNQKRARFVALASGLGKPRVGEKGEPSRGASLFGQESKHGVSPKGIGEKESRGGSAIERTPSRITQARGKKKGFRERIRLGGSSS